MEKAMCEQIKKLMMVSFIFIWIDGECLFKLSTEKLYLHWNGVVWSELWILMLLIANIEPNH